MIYVLIQQSGEYSDYSMDVLFASADKSKMESKKEKLEEAQRLSKKVMDELSPWVQELNLQYPTPKLPYNAKTNKERDLEEEKWRAKCRDIYAIRDEKTKVKTAELCQKHGIAVESYNPYYDEPDYSIMEVEEE